MSDPPSTFDSATARQFLTGCVSATNQTRHPRGRLELPCRRHDPELWFAEDPADLERAKTLCRACPIRLPCLAVAIEHAEVAGVWGGHVLDRGRIIPRKRARGRPRKDDRSIEHDAPHPEQDVITSIVPDRPDRTHLAAAHLYDAECALHAAHQSGLQAWITAANQKLHEAVSEYLTAVNTSTDRPAR